MSLEVLDGDGDVVEASEPDEPVDLEIGDGTLPPTVEEALLGRSAGETIEVTCPAGEAFGDASLEAIVSVPREEFPADLELVKGGYVDVNVVDGEGDDEEEWTLPALIVEVNDEGVILDANHPLAGKPATFRVTIESVESVE